MLLVAIMLLVALLVATGFTLFATRFIVIVIVVRLEADERRMRIYGYNCFETIVLRLRLAHR